MFSFFLFFVLFPFKRYVFWKWILKKGFNRSTKRLERVSNFKGILKKPKTNRNAFWNELKFDTLSSLFDFWGCLICLLKWVFSIYYKCWLDTLWHLQKTMKILYLFRVGALAERIFYIITVITAAGGALGEKRHYNTYYV